MSSANLGHSSGLLCSDRAADANILQVHDVKEMRDVCRVADAIFRQS